MEYFIGIDLGGTNMVCGLLDKHSNILGTVKRPTGTHRKVNEILGNIAGMIDTLLEDHELNRTVVYAVGMGVPGTTDPLNGICIGSANLGWRNVAVAEILQKKIGYPVFVDNDVKMYIYGEAMKGAGKNIEHVLGMTIGTGIAAALVSNGELHYGGGFLAGEIGHVPIEGLNHPCNCGGTGCLETDVSGPGIARLAREKIRSGESSILLDWFPDLSEITAPDISHAYDQKDKVSIQVLHDVAKHLARSLSYIIPLFSSDLIIIGGGAALTGERLLEPLRKELQQLVRPMYWQRLSICNALLIEDAGIIGSALFAQKQRNKM